MARPQQDPPGDFARLVAAEIRKVKGDKNWSGRKLAEMLGRSEKYVRERVADKLEFTLNDIEALCRLIEVTPEAFIARVESKAARPQLQLIDGGSTEDGPSTITRDEERALRPLPKAAKRGKNDADIDHAE